MHPRSRPRLRPIEVPDEVEEPVVVRGAVVVPVAVAYEPNALQYLHEVREQVAPAAYDGLLLTMRDFKLGKIETSTVVRRVEHMFRSHSARKRLLLGFSRFLPRPDAAALLEKHGLRDARATTASACTISAQRREAPGSAGASLCPPRPPLHRGSSGGSCGSSDGGAAGGEKCSGAHMACHSRHSTPAAQRSPQSPCTPLIADAMSYLDDVRDAFEQEVEDGIPHARQKYNAFISTLQDFHTARIGTSEVVRQVAELMQSDDNRHASLLERFRVFLPPGYSLPVRQSHAATAAERSP